MFQELLKFQEFHNFGHMLIPIAYFLLHFMQLPVLDFGLDHSGSEGFNCGIIQVPMLETHVRLGINNLARMNRTVYHSS